MSDAVSAKAARDAAFTDWWTAHNAWAIAIKEWAWALEQKLSGKDADPVAAKIKANRIWDEGRALFERYREASEAFIRAQFG